MNTEWKQKTE